MANMEIPRGSLPTSLFPIVAEQIGFMGCKSLNDVFLPWEKLWGKKKKKRDCQNEPCSTLEVSRRFETCNDTERVLVEEAAA